MNNEQGEAIKLDAREQMEKWPKRGETFVIILNIKMNEVKRWMRSANEKSGWGETMKKVMRWEN